MTKIFAIRHKETKEFIVFNSKCAWTTLGGAKNAFAMHRKVLFNNQADYEVIDLTEIVWMYEDLQK